ncbi:MAG TPA: M12 family metallo-peptidase [Candidatus Thermoplasmatota archaeon]|nr:M12 family metallo-peptidase [Candidatus Thermoplasmatota archaeon]
MASSRLLLPTLALVVAMPLLQTGELPLAAGIAGASKGHCVDEDLCVEPSPTHPCVRAGPRWACLPVSCLRGPMPPPLASPLGLLNGWDPRTFEVALAVDGEFVTAHGAAWRQEALSIFATVGAFYSRWVNLRVAVVDLHVHHFAGDENERLEQLSQHYRQDHSGLRREATHLLSGSGEGGLASCIGTAGKAEEAFSVSTAAHPNGVPGLLADPEAAARLAAHELGHLLAAHHHYANCIEPAGGYDPQRPRQACTIMVPKHELTTLSMSAMERLVMRGHAEGANL